MSNALDDLLEELPWDYDETDTAERLLDYRERAAAELAELHAQHAAAAKELRAALDEARRVIEPMAKAWNESLSIEEAVTLDDLCAAAAFLEKYPKE